MIDDADQQRTKRKQKESNVTLALPSAIVIALYETWKTARKKMKMCSWCSALMEMSDTFPSGHFVFMFASPRSLLLLWCHDDPAPPPA
jgi:hypothetical protein